MGSLDRTYPQNRSIQERRNRWRYPLELEATLWPKAGPSHAVAVTDLSPDGAGLRTPRDLAVGSTGVLRLERAGRALRLPYTVVWAQEIQGLKRAGLVFTLMDTLRAQLALLIDETTA